MIEVGNSDLRKERFISTSLTQRFEKPLRLRSTVWDGGSRQTANVHQPLRVSITDVPTKCFLWTRRHRDGRPLPLSQSHNNVDPAGVAPAPAAEIARSMTMTLSVKV